MPRAIALGLLVALLCACGLAAPSPTPTRLTPAAVVRAWRAAGLAGSGPTPTAADRDYGGFFAGAPVGSCTTWVVVRPEDAQRGWGATGFVADCPDDAAEDRLWAYLTDLDSPLDDYTTLRNRNLLLTFWWSAARPPDLSGHRAVFLGLR
jgi:hypothetical protein